MKHKTFRLDRGRKRRALSVFIGIVINVLLSLITYRAGLPVYLDTVGTIAAAALGGLFPGIMTAIATNTVCMLFNSDALYFGIVNIAVAIFTAWFVRNKSLRKVGNIALFILTAGILSGGMSALIQWGLVGAPQNALVRTWLAAAEGMWNVPELLVFCALLIVLNLLDKGIAFGLAMGLLALIPQSVRVQIRDSGWKQHPLSKEQMKPLDTMSGDSRFSLKRRISLMLLLVSLTLTAFVSIGFMKLYYKNYKEEKKQLAMTAARLASEVVEPDRIDAFISGGASEEGYLETEKRLWRIREASQAVEYLYVIQLREDGCYFVFDLDTEEEPGYLPGESIEFEEAFFPYLDALFAGEEIEPIESDDITGWVVTAYYPIRDENGVCHAYAGADISMSKTADYMKHFMLRIILITVGFLVTILAYALWVTGIYVVYPINRVVSGVEEIVTAGNDQEKLDDAVRGLRAINVHTGDEVERLYHAICEMASSQTEQLRSIRKFSEDTARMQEGLIVTMADLVENRDSDTGAHVQKTAAYVKIIVEGLQAKGYYAEKITPKFISDVVRSAPLHDVGKINIPDHILNKPGKLTDEEYEIIKTHTTAGKKIMEKAISTVEGESYLKEARNMAAYHHERWDGKGYPEGLHGEVIPLAARIMAVADVFDALASPRVYKPAFPLEKALAILQEGAGTQFDPKCVEVFMDSLPEVKEVLQKYQQNERGDQ